MIEFKELSIEYVASDGSPSGGGIGEQYCLEAPNGLIMFVGETTSDWFFPSRKDIELCGFDQVTSVDSIKETGNTEAFTRQQLATSWGEFLAGSSDLKCLPKIKQLVRPVEQG